MGVSSDELNKTKKDRPPVFPERERMAIIAGLDVVDDVFLEESLELKRSYILEHRASLLIMGDDWNGRFDELHDICDVIYLPRTPSISTTALIEKISSK